MMLKLINSFILLFIIITLTNCVEKPSYSGKILSKDLNYESLKNKKDIIDKMGRPNFIDPIDKNFYYFSEKKLTKNFFNQKSEYIFLTVFNFDKNDNIISYEIKNLETFNEIELTNDKTENRLVERGLIEKVFGGIGRQLTPDTSE